MKQFYARIDMDSNLLHTRLARPDLRWKEWEKNKDVS